MEYFFRHVADGEVSFNVAVVKLCLLFVILGVYRFRHSKWLLQVTFIGLLILQGLLMVWYLGEPALFLKEGLPFYHCRLVACILPFAYWLKREKLTLYLAWLGIIGTIVAFSVPDPSKYLWPHITNLTYIGSHVLLMVSGILVLAQIHSALKVKTVFAISTYMNGCLVGVNLVLHANYSYLMALPFDLGFRPSLPLIFGAMTLLMTAFWQLGKLYASYTLDN